MSQTSQLNTSILADVKRGMNGIDPTDTSFDEELIMYINTIFFKLNQIGVGPQEPYYIESGNETWDNFSNKIAYMLSVKAYMIAECRLKFDPPTSSTLYKALESTKNEYEWRLMNSKKEWRE